jgi:hypothetical protein
VLLNIAFVIARGFVVTSRAQLLARRWVFVTSRFVIDFPESNAPTQGYN